MQLFDSIGLLSNVSNQDVLINVIQRIIILTHPKLVEVSSFRVAMVTESRSDTTMRPTQKVMDEFVIFCIKHKSSQHDNVCRSTRSAYPQVKPEKDHFKWFLIFMTLTVKVTNYFFFSFSKLKNYLGETGAYSPWVFSLFLFFCLFCFVLFCLFLFYFYFVFVYVLFCFVLFCFILFFVLFCFVLFCFVFRLVVKGQFPR